MADIEKVIKGIRKCLSQKPCSENGCQYEDECAVEHLNDPLLRDALALLKEQDDLLKHEYWRGYNNGRADERGLQVGTIMQTFSPD